MRRVALTGIGLLATLAACNPHDSESDTATCGAYAPDWDGVTAFFADECLACHGDSNTNPVVLPEAIVEDLRTGAGFYVVPGDPDASRLWRVLSDDLVEGDYGVMPLGTGPLPVCEID